MFSFSLNWLNVTHPLLIYMQQQLTIGCCSFDSWKLEKSRWVPTNPLLLCNVRLLWREKPIDIPASVSVFVCKWAACIHKIQNSHPLHTQSLSFWQQTQLLYWGHHYKLSRGGIKGSLTAPSNTHPAWPPRLWPLDTLKMRARWKEGILGAFPRDEFDHTSSKNESIIQNPTKAGVEAFLVFSASLLRGALFLCGPHWAWECQNND